MTRGFLARILPLIEARLRDGYLNGLPPTPPLHRPASFRESVDPGHGAHPRLVAEYKRRSPAHPKTVLTTHNPREFVELAETTGVNALSVVAIEPEFGGSPRTVADVAGATGLPVLSKDIVIDPLQIQAAAQAGASAVLLIARLDREERVPTPLPLLSRAAHQAGLEVLLEFHDERDLDLAESVEADVYAVNVRNLDTLRLEPEVALKTLRAARGLSPLMALSGISRPEDALPFLRAGAGAVLVGAGIAQSADPRALISGILSLPRGPDR